MAQKPVPGEIPVAAPRPTAETTRERRRWSFSLRFWRQIENFGVGAQPSKWFVSLLDRLHEMSRLSVEDVLSDYRLQDALRVHDIDWQAKNIPIERKDIEWVDKVYWDNPAEFPLMQFHVSKGMGRIAGFMDENLVFNVVLLDPMHNLQPSKKNDYRIRGTRVGECELVALATHMESVIHARLTGDAKGAMLMELRRATAVNGATVLHLPLDEKSLTSFDALVDLAGHPNGGEYLMQLVDEAVDKLG